VGIAAAIVCPFCTRELSHTDCYRWFPVVDPYCRSCHRQRATVLRDTAGGRRIGTRATSTDVCDRLSGTSRRKM